MKLSTSKSELQSALQKLLKATPARSTLPILSCILFRVEDEKTILRSTDLEITIVITLPASIEEKGASAIPIQTLLDITNELPDGRLTIAVDNHYRVELISETGIYHLMAKPAEEFPALPEISEQRAVAMTPDTLRRIIEKTSFAVSRDELKPALTGLYFHIDQERLTAVATDGHRLARHILKNYQADEFVGEVIIPNKFLNLASALLPSTESIQIWIGENHLTAAFDEDMIYTRTIDEKYPDYETVIPTDNDKILEIELDTFLGAVRRVSIFSNRSTHLIALRLTEEKISISTEDPEKASEGQEELSARYTGDPLTIGYNASYLKDVLSHVDGNKVVVKLKTPISAALFYPETLEENNDITMLLMPIRLE